MKTFIKLCLLSILVGNSPLGGETPVDPIETDIFCCETYVPSGWYIAGYGAVGYLHDIDLQNPGAGGDIQLKWDPGYMLGAEFGYLFCSGWRTGIDLSYKRYCLRHFSYKTSGAELGARGHFEMPTLLLNALWEGHFCSYPSLQPIVGLGLGIGNAHLCQTSNGSVRINCGRDVFVARGHLGCSYQLDDNTAISLNYRMEYASKPEWKDNNGQRSHALDAPIIHHVGVTVKFVLD